LITLNVLLGSVVFLFPGTQHRIMTFVRAIEKYDQFTLKDKMPRRLIWENGSQIVKENWLFGVGTGDVK
ncbi:MAG: hypothetical protein ACPG4Z_06780, partial [Chitinophagales bacterium]